MGRVISLKRPARISVRVSVFPLSADIADVEITTPDHVTSVMASRYDAAALLQRLERSSNPAAELVGFVEAHGEGA